MIERGMATEIEEIKFKIIVECYNSPGVAYTRPQTLKIKILKKVVAWIC